MSAGKKAVAARSWRSILVVIPDLFSDQQPVLTKAAAVARRTGARLTLFNPFMIPQPVTDVPLDDYEQVLNSAMRKRREVLQSLARKMRLSNRTQCVVSWDYPTHEAIIREVLRSGPDLVITTSHRHGKLARWILSNTDWELIRSCPCPVWFSRSDSLPAKPRALVAIDPRHTHAKPARLDDRLLMAARTLTSQLGGGISIVHAFDAPTPTARYAGTSALSLRLRANSSGTDPALKARELVNRFAENHGVAAPDRFALPGDATEVIANTVRRTAADVLVMGAVSRRRLDKPVIGNTAEKVIDAVSCDVLVVKPRGFRTGVARRVAKAKRLPA